MATTTSVRDAGLLDLLLPAFEEGSGYRVRVVAVGSGQAMALGRRGEADILILHDPAGEAKFMADGFGKTRSAFMHNEFVIVGPGSDPAGVRIEGSARQAMRKIAHSGVLFVSRGDRSGTFVKELGLWGGAAVQPTRGWYRESGQGMSATLQIASQLQAYALTDIGTLLSHRGRLDLEILFEGDSLLDNPYHIIVVDGVHFDWVNEVGALALERHLLSSAAQRAIEEFGHHVFGRSLFVPDALDNRS